MYGEGDHFWRPNHSLLDDAWNITTGYKEHYLSWQSKPRATSMNPYPQELFFSRMKKHVINQFDWTLAVKDEIEDGVDIHGNPEWRFPALGHIGHGDQTEYEHTDWHDDATQPNVLIKFFIVNVGSGTAIRMTWESKFKRLDGGDYLFVDPDEEPPDFEEMKRESLNGNAWNLLQRSDVYWDETLTWVTGIPFEDTDQFYYKYVASDGDHAAYP
jgi:hypothetical protein